MGEDTGPVRSRSQEGPPTGGTQPKAGPRDARERGGRAQGNTRADGETPHSGVLVQPLSRVQLFATDRMRRSTPGFPVRHRLPDFARVPWARAASHRILYRPLLLSSGSFPVSQFFTSGGQSFSISPSNEYSGLIFFRIDWLDLLAVQGTLKSLLQHHSSKASILWHCFLYSPTLTYVYDYWKNHSFD